MIKPKVHIIGKKFIDILVRKQDFHAILQTKRDWSPMICFGSYEKIIEELLIWFEKAT